MNSHLSKANVFGLIGRAVVQTKLRGVQGIYESNELYVLEEVSARRPQGSFVIKKENVCVPQSIGKKLTKSSLKKRTSETQMNIFSEQTVWSLKILQSSDIQL